MRKSLHLLAMVIPLSMLYLGKEVSLWILVPFSMLAITIEVARVKSVWVADLVEKIFGLMMRSQERPAIGAPVVFNGATWVLISATLLIFFFPVKIAASSMIAFMIGDAAAALIGRRFGRLNIGSLPKTVEGSIGFLVVASVTLILFNVLPFHLSLLVALAGTLLELAPIPLNDNIYVPLCMAGLMYWLV